MSRTIRRRGPLPWWIRWETDEEFIERYWGSRDKLIARYRSDAWDDRGAGKWGKRFWAKQRRSWDRQELSKFKKEFEYEPIFFTTKIDTWFWD